MIILDRITEDTAYLEDDGAIFPVPISRLCPGALEGDVLILQEDGRYAPNTEKTHSRKAAIRKKMDAVLKR